MLAGMILSKKKRYQGSFLTIYSTSVQLPDGRRATCDVIEHPPAVVIVPVLPDGRLVLLRQYRPVISEYLLELPAGKLDPGEAPEAGAARELEEETGYRAGTLRAITGFYPAPGSMTEWMTLFVASDLRLARAHRDEDELIELKRMTLEQALARADNGKIKDAKSLVGLLAYARSLASPRRLRATAPRPSRRAPRAASSAQRR